ncbi:hypothetical protein V2J09_003147 [Rumex salicifolius]
MGNPTNALTILVSITVATAHHTLCFSTNQQKPDGLGSWARNIPNHKEKLTHLHFYFHDWMSPARDKTAYPVARSPITATNPYLFGLTFMIDDPLTMGSDPHSEPVGRAYGFYGLTGMREFTLFNMMGFLFTRGKYKGSSVSMVSYNPAMHPERELALVGGTGAFRMARGVARARTVYQNITTGGAIIEYDFYIFHY